MMVWLDAHISPLLATWIASEFDCECKAFRELGFEKSQDRVVFFAAKLADAIIVSKDSDFGDLQRLYGPPPKVIWLRYGNRSNEDMKKLLATTLPDAFRLLRSDALVEIRNVDLS